MKRLLNNAKIGEVDTISRNLLMLYDRYDVAKNDSFLRDTFADMRVQSEKITELINREKITTSLNDYDKMRSNYVRRIYKLIEGYSGLSDCECKHTAEQIKSILDSYGLKILKTNYLEKSSFIESLLYKFNLDDNRNKLNQLQGVTELVQQLRESETNFKETMITMNQLKSSKRATEPASKIKRKLISIINKQITTYLIAKMLTDEAQYSAFYQAVSEMIERANKAIIARRDKDNAATNTETTPIEAEAEESEAESEPTEEQPTENAPESTDEESKKE